MSKAKMLFGLGAACAACCAVPLAVPLLAAAGISLAGTGAMLSTWWLAIAGAVVAIAVTLIALRRRRTAGCS